MNGRPVYDVLAVYRERRQVRRMDAVAKVVAAGHPSAAGLSSVERSRALARLLDAPDGGET